MANHKSALKRIRQDRVKNLRNRYYAKTMRNAVAALRKSTDKKTAEKELPRVVSMIDRLSKRNVIHSNKAANLKSSLATHVASL